MRSIATRSGSLLLALTFGMGLLFGFSTPAAAGPAESGNCKLVNDGNGRSPNTAGSTQDYLFQYNDAGGKDTKSSMIGSGTYYRFIRFSDGDCIWRSDFNALGRAWFLESIPTMGGAGTFGEQCKVNNGIPVSDGATGVFSNPVNDELTVSWPFYTCRYSQSANGYDLEEVLGSNASPAPPGGSTGSGGPTPGVAPVLDTENIENLGNGLAWYALAAAVTGIFISASLWALGSKGQNPGQELTGKRGIIVCLAAAFAVGGLNPFMNVLNDMASDLDRTNPTIEQKAGINGSLGGGNPNTGGKGTEGSLDN